MSKNTEKVTLGSGDLFMNNVEVGHLKGDVEFVYEKETVEFKPSNMLGPVKVFVVGENSTLKASMAELSAANMRLAMGISSAVDANTSFPAYDPSSYAVPEGADYNVIKFGGEQALSEVPLRFEHTRKSDGKKIIVILYKAVSLNGLTIPFHESDINLTDVTFKGLADASRAAGDQVGFIAEQI